MTLSERKGTVWSAVTFDKELLTFLDENLKVGCQKDKPLLLFFGAYFA